MRMLEAFDATLELAEEHGMPTMDIAHPAMTYQHLVDMRKRMYNSMGGSKLGRWLGWAQCAVAAATGLPLERFMAMNCLYADKKSAHGWVALLNGKLIWSQEQPKTPHARPVTRLEMELLKVGGAQLIQRYELNDEGKI